MTPARLWLTSRWTLQVRFRPRACSPPLPSPAHLCMMHVFGTCLHHTQAGSRRWHRWAGAAAAAHILTVCAQAASHVRGRRHARRLSLCSCASSGACAGRPSRSLPADEHVIEMAEVPRVPKAALSARQGSQDLPLLNAAVRRSPLRLTVNCLRAGRAHPGFVVLRWHVLVGGFHHCASAPECVPFSSCFSESGYAGGIAAHGLESR